MCTHTHIETHTHTQTHSHTHTHRKTHTHRCLLPAVTDDTFLYLDKEKDRGGTRRKD